MHARDRKLAILRQLSQEAEPISLQEVMSKVSEEATERTVRRWLQELVREGLVKKLGATKSAKYVALKAPPPSSDHVSSIFSAESHKAITLIKRPIFERPPITYPVRWLSEYKPNSTFYIPKKILEELEQAGKRANNHDPAGTYAHKIFNRLLIDLSYNSSRLEGNTYSLLDTEKLILHGELAEGKLNEENVMILNHKEAIRYLVENAPRIQIDRNVVCTLHYLLSDGLVEWKYAGKIRDHGVRIGGSTYIPLEDPKQLERQLIEIAKKGALINNPFEQSLFLLIHISYLQAFADVNKRTARLSANLPLITRNLVPLSFNAIEVDDYMSAMIAIYELQDVRPLVDLYVYSYMRTCVAYDSTVQSLGFDEIRVRYRKERRAILREILNRSLTGVALENFITEETQKTIPQEAEKAFLEDLYEDLEQIDESRLAGLGVAPKQLQAWLQKAAQSNRK